MKKFMQSVGMRVFSCLLCTVCVLVLGISAVASVFYAEMQTESYTYKNGAQKIADSYALYALQYFTDNQDMEEVEEFLSSHGLYCEIVLNELQGKDTESKVLYSNASKDTEWMYQTEVVKGTAFKYLLSTMWSALGNSDYNGPDAHWKEFIIQDYVYDAENGIFYYKTEAGYFPIQDIYVIYKDDTLNCDYTLKTIDNKQCYYNTFYDTALDISQYTTWSAISLDGIQLDMEKEIELIKDGSLVEKKVYDVIYTYDEHAMSNAISCYYQEPTDTYTIQIGWDKDSMATNYFTEWNEACTFIYTFQNNLVSIVVISFLLFLLGFVVMIYSTIEEKEQLGFLHRVPVGIYSGVLLLIEYVLLLAAMEGMGELIYHGMIQMDMAYCVLAILVFTIVLIAMIYVQNLITRFRTRSFLRYSELHYAVRILKVSWKIFENITIVPLRRMKRAVQENTSIIVKGLGVFIGISILEFVFYAWSNFHGEIMMFWIVAGKCIEIPIILYVLIQMKKLQEGTKRIASGDLTTPIDTHKMYWEFKKHGENINNVSQSIQLAVEQQMKSERFKTELITNVSHDIKTPLTSIINYVDLIKKEEITDEKLCEYVDVLDRQSARLKKLIEDLMEASKASTGNLAVHLEDCDVEVLLTQVIGEFEERLQGNQLQVVVSKPDHPIPIRADGRHMWRVLDNLLGNACKYAMPNTRVYVSLEQQGKEAVIVFKNISKAALNIPSEELMERFVRGDSSRNTEGSGLGLSIAQSLTELMHGTMQLDIDGDLFKVTLRFPV